MFCLLMQWSCMSSALSGELFESFEVDTGFAWRQTILTGFLLDSMTADLAVIHVAENGDRHLRILGFDPDVKTWVPALEATLPPGVQFVDVANIGGRDRLLMYQRGELNWFDPGSAAVNTLIEVVSGFEPPRGNEIPHVDVTRDVNGDGRDDLLIPGVNGFWLAIQMDNGAFADLVKIDASADMSGIYGADGYRYDPWSQSRVHELDFDGDKRNDLVVWHKDRFEVYSQDGSGQFSENRQSFTTTVAFDSDDLYSLAEAEMTGKVLHYLGDVNGDAVADLGLLALSGKSVPSKRSTHEVHFGSRTADGGILFAEDVSVAVRSNDHIQIGMKRRDFNDDGQVDLMFTTINVKYLQSSLFKRLKGFMGDDIWLDLEFYSVGDGAESVANKRIQLHDTGSIREPGWVPLDVVLRGGTHVSRKTRSGEGCLQRDIRCSPHDGTFNAPLLIGDVTGDGRSDLLIGTTPEWLDVFTGIPGPALFTQEPRAIAVQLPKDGEFIWLADVNGCNVPLSLREIIPI